MGETLADLLYRGEHWLNTKITGKQKQGKQRKKLASNTGFYIELYCIDAVYRSIDGQGLRFWS